MQAYKRFPQPDGSFLYWPYDGSVYTSEQADAQFALLTTYEQKVAATTAVQPALDPGFSGWKVRTGTVVTPPPTSKLFGAPRTLLGTRNGYKVYSGTGLNYLLEVYQDSPDQFAPKGGNMLGISFATGVTLPAGLVETDFYGQAPPAGFLDLDYRMLGYRKRYFGGKADQAYYELSTEADEVPTPTEEPVSETITTGVVSANPGIGTFSTANNGEKWKITLNSTYDVTGGNHAYFFIDGEKHADFGGFDFLPGDQISVYYVVAPTDANYDQWNAKTWALITFGNI